VRWIVDGNNVMGARPDGWWRDRAGAARSLAARIAAVADAGDEPIVLVFDGRPRELGLHSGTRLEVRFAERAGPDAADDVIAGLVAAAEEPAQLRVVTSDAALAARVRAAGAEVVGAGAFRQRLDDVTPGAGGAR
jgi:predicted RNA-binding protein with PIN domain